MRHSKIAAHRLEPIAKTHPLIHMTPPPGEARNTTGTSRIVLRVWVDPQGQIFIEWHRLAENMRTRFTKLKGWLEWVAM